VAVRFHPGSHFILPKRDEYGSALRCKHTQYSSHFMKK